MRKLFNLIFVSIVYSSFIYLINGQLGSDLFYQSNFKTYMVAFDKTYATLTEQEKRYTVWKKNFDYITKHNAEADAGNHTYWLKMNHLGDLV